MELSEEDKKNCSEFIEGLKNAFTERANEPHIKRRHFIFDLLCLLKIHEKVIHDTESSDLLDFIKVHTDIIERWAPKE